MAAETMELMKVDSFKEIIEKAPDTLALNQNSSEKAAEAGEALLIKIASEGMSEAMDQECNNYLVKLKKTLDLMQERRKPVTQIFDEVKKLFTGLEAKVDPKGEIYSKVQKVRNDFAEKKAREQREKEEAARKKLLSDKEKIDVQTSLHSKLKQFFLDYQEKVQQELIDMFEAITLKDFAQVSESIADFPTIYPIEHFESFSDPVRVLYISRDEVSEIQKAVKLGKFEEFSTEFKETIHGLKEVFVDKLPSKRKELQAIAKANEAEKERLEKEAAKRKQDQLDALAKSTQDKKEQAADEAEVSGQVMKANTLFDHETSLASTSESSAQIRESFEIIVTNPVGYLQIVAFYFEKEGKSETIEKLEKKTLSSMKKFCEAYANKHDEKLQNPYLQYKEVFKAVAKK